jgi:uncharacterized membrane protein
MVEEAFRQAALAVALGAEGTAVLLVGYGVLTAFVGVVRILIDRDTTHGRRKDVWRRFAGWLLLALEFELAADIVRSVVAPTWMEIGQLGAIAVIRTVLNYFLEQDFDRAREAV